MPVNRDTYKEVRLRSIKRKQADRKKYNIISAVLIVPAIACVCVGSIAGLVLFGGAAAVCFIIAEQEKQSANKLQEEIDTMDTRDLEAEQKQIELQAKIAGREAAQKRLAEHPPCPMCKSSNTRHITDAARLVSVAAIGLASSKIGKQFECLDCKYKW